PETGEGSLYANPMWADLGRGSQGLLPGLLQGAPHEYAGHSALIVGGTTRIANGIGLLLRHSSRLAEQLGRQALTAHYRFSRLGTQWRCANTPQSNATVLTGPSGRIHLDGGSDTHGGVIIGGAGQEFDIGAPCMGRWDGHTNRREQLVGAQHR